MNAVLVGLGMVAETHLRAVAGAGINLAGVMAQSATKAKAFAEAAADTLGYMPRVYVSADEIVADAGVDFVILCTPPNARLELVKTFAGAGKHILMEKPIERDAVAAEAIVEICEVQGVTLGVVLQHRMREASQQLAKLLNEDAFGAVALAEISVPWWRDQSYYNEPGRGTYARDGGGVLISQAIHTLDLALSLLGPVATVTASAHTTALHAMESEDFVQASLVFASGAIGSVTCSTASFPGRAETITLHCAKASAILETGRLIVHWRDGKVQKLGTENATGGGADPMAFTHDWHQAILTDFIAALHEGRAPVAPGREALNVQQLIDAMILSSRNDSTISLSKDR
ncbi:Gfo/Idh/MocA family oxidoreductase [Pacificibacter sp. AS14]|uniref:Gfo/Idh/MocA family protein n=1 Tax=Pacificibacter sp. AS14 TaxID=3135785 RepID=UPI00317E66E0